MYIYESHLGGLFCRDKKLSYEEECCETCGDIDTYIGRVDNKKDAWELLKSITDINGSGGYDYEYVKEFIDNYFD